MHDSEDVQTQLPTFQIIRMNSVPELIHCGTGPWMLSNGKTFAACLSKVQLEKLIWHQFSRANQLEVISPPLVFTQHAAHWLLLLIRSYFQPVESLCGAVDGPPRMHIPDSGWTICGAYVSSERAVDFLSFHLRMLSSNWNCLSHSGNFGFCFFSVFYTVWEWGFMAE